MKSILMLAVFACAPMMALAYGDSSEQQMPQFISWCDGDNVIGQNSQGQLVIRAQCATQGLECKATETYRQNGSTVTATCVDKK